MEKNESIEHVLENMDKNIIRKTKGSVFLPLLLIAFGISSLVAYASYNWEANNLFAQTLFILGNICLIVGIVKLFFRKSYYVFAEDKQKIKNFEIYFNLIERDKLISIIESGNLMDIKQLKSSIVDGLKLRFMATKDGKLCFSQIVGFISYEYVYLTPVKKYSQAEYQILSEIFKSRK